MSAYPHTRRNAIADLDEAGYEWGKLKMLEEAARERRDRAIVAALAAGCSQREVARHARVKPSRINQILAAAGTTARRSKGSYVDSTVVDEQRAALVAAFDDVGS
jgi:hypothetical protein